MAICALRVVQMERILLVMGKVGHAVVVGMRDEGIAMRVTPVLAMVVRMRMMRMRMMHEARIPHSSRPVRDVGAVMPIGTKRALVV